MFRNFDISMLALGLPFDGDTLETKSLGGSESAAMYMAKALAREGARVIVFCNTASSSTDTEGVQYLPAATWPGYANSTPHDVCIVQRAPDAFRQRTNARLNLLWCHDLALGRQEQLFRGALWNVDRVMVLSEFMRDQYKEVNASYATSHCSRTYLRDCFVADLTRAALSSSGARFTSIRSWPSTKDLVRPLRSTMSTSPTSATSSKAGDASALAGTGPYSSSTKRVTPIASCKSTSSYATTCTWSATRWNRMEGKSTTASAPSAEKRSSSSAILPRQTQSILAESLGYYSEALGVLGEGFEAALQIEADKTEATNERRRTLPLRLHRRLLPSAQTPRGREGESV